MVAWLGDISLSSFVHIFDRPDNSAALLSQIWVLLLVLFHSFTPCPCWCHFLSKALLLLLEVNDRVCRILTAAFKKGWVFGVPLMQFHFLEKVFAMSMSWLKIKWEICHRFFVNFLFRFYRYIVDGQTILMRLLAKQMKFFVLQEGHLAANAKATGSAWALRWYQMTH